MRRFAALLAAISLAGFVNAERPTPCADHDAAAASAHAPAAHASAHDATDDGMPGMGHAAPPSGRHAPAPCDAPANHACCTAMASCGVSVDASIVAQFAAAPVLRGVAHPTNGGALPSAVRVPDPPPPKA